MVEGEPAVSGSPDAVRWWRRVPRPEPVPKGEQQLSLFAGPRKLDGEVVANVVIRACVSMGKCDHRNPLLGDVLRVASLAFGLTSYGPIPENLGAVFVGGRDTVANRKRWWAAARFLRTLDVTINDRTGEFVGLANVDPDGVGGVHLGPPAWWRGKGDWNRWRLSGALWRSPRLGDGRGAGGQAGHYSGLARLLAGWESRLSYSPTAGRGKHGHVPDALRPLKEGGPGYEVTLSWRDSTILSGEYVAPGANAKGAEGRRYWRRIDALVAAGYLVPASNAAARAGDTVEIVKVQRGSKANAPSVRIRASARYCAAALLSQRRDQWTRLPAAWVLGDGQSRREATNKNPKLTTKNPKLTTKNPKLTSYRGVSLPDPLGAPRTLRPYDISRDGPGRGHSLPPRPSIQPSRRGDPGRNTAATCGHALRSDDQCRPHGPSRRIPRTARLLPPATTTTTTTGPRPPPRGQGVPARALSSSSGARRTTSSSPASTATQTRPVAARGSRCSTLRLGASALLDHRRLTPSSCRAGARGAGALAAHDALAKAGVAFVALKENIRIEGKRDIQTKVMTTLFALFAEVERDLISERTREGLARARSSGRKLGRPKGFCLPWSGRLREGGEIRVVRIACTALSRVGSTLRTPWILPYTAPPGWLRRGVRLGGPAATSANDGGGVHDRRCVLAVLGSWQRAGIATGPGILRRCCDRDVEAGEVLPRPFRRRRDGYRAGSWSRPPRLRRAARRSWTGTPAARRSPEAVLFVMSTGLLSLFMGSKTIAAERDLLNRLRAASRKSTGTGGVRRRDRSSSEAGLRRARAELPDVVLPPEEEEARERPFAENLAEADRVGVMDL